MTISFRNVLTLLVAGAAILCFRPTLAAAATTTGAISGHITDADTRAPLADVKVSAVSPSGSYETTTSASGFYAIIGLGPDTYLVTASKGGYQSASASGATVTQGVSLKIDLQMQSSAKTIGHVTVRAASGLVQPDVTTDSYSVNTQQQDTLKGTPLASEQFGLLTELPGVSSAGGYPLLRGGLENNEGFQIEGISVTEPFFNQFDNNDEYNGAQSIKVVLGPGDATQGGAGSGYINEVVKRGTYPPFGTLQSEFGIGSRANNLNFEYGDATRDKRFSYFFSGRFSPLGAAGPYKPNQAVQGIRLNDQITTLANVVNSDFVTNFYYNFGRNNTDQLQFFDQHGLQNFLGSYGLQPFLSPYFAYDPIYQGIYNPLTPAQLPLYPYQPAGQQFSNVPGQIQEYELTKVGFSRPINSTTFFNAKLYRLNGITRYNLTQSDYPYLGLGFPSLFNDFYEETPYQTTGLALDVQKQLNDRHFLSVGYEYKFSRGGLLNVYPLSLTANWLPHELGDFVPGGGGPFDPAVFGSVVRIPLAEFGTRDPEYVTNAYVTDQIKPGERWTIQPGLRYETQLIHQPVGLYSVHASSPKLGLSYAMNPNTVMRATYGHSTVFAPLGQVETTYQAPSFFKGFPATASICGGFSNGFSLPCANYYDQIINDVESNIGISPAAFPKPQQSDSYDFSIERRWANGISAKFTPWYRRDYDVVTNQALPIFVSGTLVNGPQTVTNNGSGRSFGLDLGIDREVAQGLSGQLNLTYINQFINYQSAGAFLPVVSPAILATLAHPPYLSPFTGTLALDYKHSGWRVNPIFTYSRGTPQGASQFFYTNLNGIYQSVPNTNYYGSPTNPCYFVDPQVPGSAPNPNIVGSLGIGCSKARNASLGLANVIGQLTVSRDITSYSTAGITISNLFNNQVSTPYSNLPGGNASYVNNGFGAYGAGSGFSQYGPAGLNILGAPSAFPPGPYFNTLSGNGRSALFFVNVRM